MDKIKIYLFYFTLLLLPFNIRHIFNFEQVKAIEGFREHISRSVYGFDIAFILLITFLVISFTMSFLRSHVIRERQGFAGMTIIILFFALCILISSLFSQNQQIAFYNSARIIEVLTFFIIAKNSLTDQKAFNASALIIFFSGILQSILAIVQFISQQSIGLKFLGESIISPHILGVAKIELSGEKFIRAYGTFPHPNLLGAFLLFSLVCGIYYFKLKVQNSKFEIQNSSSLLGIFLIISGIFLTFSRSIWLSTFAFLLYIFIKNHKPIFNFFNFKIHFKFKILNFKFILAGIIILVPLLFLVIHYAPSRLCLANCNDNSYSLRKIYNLSAIEIIKAHPFAGIGPGNFTLSNAGEISSDAKALKDKHESSLEPWENQPVHNLYLLIASETGLIGLIIFISILISIFKQFSIYQFKNYQLKIKSLKIKKLIVNCKLIIINFKTCCNENPQPNIFIILILLFLFQALFDHYFWTLPQGQFTLWLSLAFLANSSKIKE